MVDKEIRVATRALSRADLDVDSVERVTTDGEPVFRAETDAGPRYAKLLHDWKGAALAEVVDYTVEIGLPSPRLVQTERYVLVTEPAPGWPLSTTLPVYFLPFAWWVARRRGLATALRRVGARLGRLHAVTSEGPRTPRDQECRISKRLHLDDRVRQRLEQGQRQRIERRLEDVGNRRLPGCKIHGDPTPHNLFWSPRTGDIALIDFNLHSSVALEDVVVLEAGLELMTRRLPHGRRSQCVRLVNAFRAGYRETGLHDRLPADALGALKLGYYCHLLEKVLNDATRGGVAERITRVTDRPVIEQRIRSLADGTTDASNT